MKVFEKIRAIPTQQKFRYMLIMLSCTMFFAPFVFLPSLVGNSDLCGRLCMRRFYLMFPGMSPADIASQVQVASVGVYMLATILITTFFYGRMWCAYICPVGGLPELASRSLNDRWKIEYRALPQVPIRYGYFSVFVMLMPMLGISACTLCNFITVPRLIEAFNGDSRGIAFLFSAVGLVNLGLLLLLGFFASKGRAYCQFLCPIGALDGLVNRLGAKLKFTRRIRVERSRCTGCNICARNCMTGAIQMVDRIAVVDQLSCMSCHECVDVCDWGAIDWRSIPPDEEPKRKKKGVDFYPQPEWHAVYVDPAKKLKKEQKKQKKKMGRRWRHLMLSVMVFVVAFYTQDISAAKRHPDPDGCFSCHALKGLDYIDKEGVLRSASIDNDHYYSSLHGSVPCKDCHRKIRNYPHKVKNGEVDCAESCHVEEPSEGEAYTHKAVVKEFQKSVHGEGLSKGLTGGNRLKEATKESNPSCRKCHANELYIGEQELPKFREAFDHLDTECGKCHQGELWMGQFGGHILRRFIGGRWNKKDHNRMCNDCHADHERMAKVEIKDKKTDKKKPVGPRFILASDSYDMTLHGRLLESGVEQGASCIDCHAPKGFRHGILRDEEAKASTHTDNMAKTCAQSDCHGFATHPLNSGFVKTDLHDIDMVLAVNEIVPLDSARLESSWAKALIALLPIILIFGGGSLWWRLFGKKNKGITYAVLGGNTFQEKMIGQKARPKKKHKGKKKPVAKKPVQQSEKKGASHNLNNADANDAGKKGQEDE